MLYSYKSYTKILESKKQEKLINKYTEKIKKFINIPEVIDYCIEKTTNRDSTKGIKYSIWLANQLKKEIEKPLKGKLDLKKIFKNGIKDAFIGDKKKGDWTSVKLIVDEILRTNNAKINYILDWLKNPLRGDENISLSGIDLEKAFEMSEEWHKSLTPTGTIKDESGEILIDFKDGYYWIDLETTSCKDEANAMGHCGMTNEGDTLLSLRDKNKQPHVTVSIGEYNISDESSDRRIYQMKGKQNKKPDSKYHPYIYRLLVDPKLNIKEFGEEYDITEDFNLSDFDKETFMKVFEYKPEIFYNSIDANFEMFHNIMKKDYVDSVFLEDFIKKSGNITKMIFKALYYEYIDNSPEIKKLFIDNIDYEKFDLGNNVLVNTYLWSIGYLTDEKYVKLHTDELEIRDNKIYIYLDENSMNVDDYVKELAFGEDMDWEPSYYENDLNSMWSKFTDNTKKEIIKKMIGEEYSLDGNNIKLTDEMFNNDEILYNGGHYSIGTLLDNKKDDVYNAINYAICDAQESANRNEYYKKAKSIVEDKYSKFIREDKQTKPDSNGKINYYTNYYFEFVELFEKYDKKILGYMEGELDSGFNGSYIINFEEEYLEEIATIINEIVYDIPDKKIDDGYSLYGSINKDYLNELIVDRLSDI